jgi:hypothetical protein
LSCQQKIGSASRFHSGLQQVVCHLENADVCRMRAEQRIGESTISVCDESGDVGECWITYFEDINGCFDEAKSTMAQKKYQASASMPTASPIGSGTLSHAYIQYPPLRFNVPRAAGLMYDDGNRVLLVPFPNKVMSWPVNQKSPLDDPSETKIAEGPVLFLRFSLDGTILAVQYQGRRLNLSTERPGFHFANVADI